VAPAELLADPAVLEFALTSRDEAGIAWRAHYDACKECGPRLWARVHYCRAGTALFAIYQAWVRVVGDLGEFQPEPPPYWWMEIGP
jgi:hypothetical protein